MGHKSSRLIIGTANFGHEYNGTYVPPDEQEKIWDYCREVGIDTVDTAMAYGDIKIPDDFKVITKIKRGDRIAWPYYGALTHLNYNFEKGWENAWYHLWRCREEGLVEKIGLSIYQSSQIIYLDKLDIVQMPYHPNAIDNKSWRQDLRKHNIEVHVRNVFVNNYYKEAIADPNVDKVVIGIDSVEQLKENVRLIEKEKK